MYVILFHQSYYSVPWIRMYNNWPSKSLLFFVIRVVNLSQELFAPCLIILTLYRKRIGWGIEKRMSEGFLKLKGPILKRKSFRQSGALMWFDSDGQPDKKFDDKILLKAITSTTSYFSLDNKSLERYSLDYSVWTLFTVQWSIARVQPLLRHARL